jgi:CDP-diacylglycerol--glycerol-3-phosphate 3-phosphatidyltransferase
MSVPVFHLGDWLLAVAALLTLYSGYLYLRAAWPSLREDEQAAVDISKKDSKMPPLETRD